MSETIPKKHSRLGLASIILALGIWLYLIISGLLFFRTEFFTKFYNSYLNNKRGGMVEGFGDLAVFILFLLFLFVFIPGVGHLLGFIFGFIGSLSQTKKRLFGIIGIILNLSPFILVFIWYVSQALLKR